MKRLRVVSGRLVNTELKLGVNENGRMVEGEAQVFGEKVDGVARQIPLGPSPVTVIEDETGVSGRNKVARFAFDEVEAAL